MGVVVSSLTRRIKRFNIENRAHQEISRDKPNPAPSYPSTVKEIERVLKDNPGFLEEQSKKNIELNKRLKEVYLISHDIKVETPKSAASDRPLPLNRSAPEATEFGFREPNMIPKGRVTLRQALKFIADHQSHSDVKTASSIANEHNLPVEITENILKHFKTFELYVPDKNKAHVAIEEVDITQIESGQTGKDSK